MSKKQKLTLNYLEERGVKILNKDELPDMGMNGIRLGFSFKLSDNYRKSRFYLENPRTKRESRKILGHLDPLTDNLGHYLGHKYTSMEKFIN